MLKSSKYIFMILIFSGITSSLFANEFREVLYRKFLYADEINILREVAINSDSKISRPKLTWVALFKLNNLHKKSSACLFYYIPNLAGEYIKKGKLKLVEVTNSETCKNKFVKEGLVEQQDISGLRVYFNDTDNIKKIGTQSISSFYIKFIIEFQNRKLTYDFPTFNYREKFTNNLQRYMPSVLRSFEEGVTLIPSDINLEQTNKYLGEKNDNYPDGSLKNCHDINQKCEEKSHFKCDQCKYGWFEVVSSNCEIGGPKYCGPNRCGQKGWPACPRGFLYNQNKDKNCYDGSEAGYCEKGLKTFCDENKVLVCL